MTHFSTFTVYVRHGHLYATVIEAETEEQAVIEAEDRYFTQGLACRDTSFESWAVPHPNAGAQP